MSGREAQHGNRGQHHDNDFVIDDLKLKKVFRNALGQRCVENKIQGRGGGGIQAVIYMHVFQRQGTPSFSSAAGTPTRKKPLSSLGFT